MKNTIRVIEHLSYVVECALLDYMGDGKDELEKLIDSLKTNEIYKVDDNIEVAERLTKILNHYYDGNKRAGNGELSSVIRGLWGRVVDTKGNFQMSF